MLHVVGQDMDCLLIILEAIVIIFQFSKGFYVCAYSIKNGFQNKYIDVSLICSYLKKLMW
jgi:hypothetical protein